MGSGALGVGDGGGANYDLARYKVKVLFLHVTQS